MTMWVVPCRVSVQRRVEIANWNDLLVPSLEVDRSKHVTVHADIMFSEVLRSALSSERLDFLRRV
jgi:hypothetical protein